MSFTVSFSYTDKEKKNTNKILENDLMFRSLEKKKEKKKKTMLCVDESENGIPWSRVQLKWVIFTNYTSLTIEIHQSQITQRQKIMVVFFFLFVFLSFYLFSCFWFSLYFMVMLLNANEVIPGLISASFFCHNDFWSWTSLVG